MGNSSGWHGNRKGHSLAGKAGGLKTSQKYGEHFYSAIGKKGGRVSPGNFKNNPERAKKAGSLGGKSRQNTKKSYEN